MSRRQLHEVGIGRDPNPTFPARACGMEAEEEPQHRAKAKPRKAGMSGQACSSTRRPISSRDMTVLRTGAAGSHSSLPREIFSGPRKWKR